MEEDDGESIMALYKTFRAFLLEEFAKDPHQHHRADHTSDEARGGGFKKFSAPEKESTEEAACKGASDAYKRCAQ